MKKIIKIILIILIVLGILNLGYDFYCFHDINKKYESVDAEDTIYGLRVSFIGSFSIGDIGAGNPTMKGHLFKIPFTDNKYIVNCLFDPDFDEQFLNMKSKFQVMDIYPQIIGNKLNKDYHVIIFENGEKHIQFNEIYE